jgi:TRAP-type mannitol/chloroaromatic compound transport system permease small subunit
MICLEDEIKLALRNINYLSYESVAVVAQSFREGSVLSHNVNFFGWGCVGVVPIAFFFTLLRCCNEQICILKIRVRKKPVFFFFFFFFFIKKRPAEKIWVF